MSYMISNDGLALLKEFEGCRLKAYEDSAGIWTIGYGSTRLHGQPVVKGQTCTQQEAEDALRAHVNEIAKNIHEQITAPLTQSQIDAVICFCYNVGVYAFAKSSLRRNINTRRPVTEDLFTRWNKARDPITHELVVVPGLTERRRREYTLFTKG